MAASYDFKNEEEVKEYLNNLGTEYKFSCFHEKNAEGCHLLGDYEESIQRDFAAAAKLFKSNCDDNNYPKSCLKYGSYSFLGKGCAADTLTSLNYYKKACDLNDKDGCLYAGVMLTKTGESKDDTKDKIKLDYVTGLKYLEKSCSANNFKACYYASALHITGAEGIPQNRTKAAALSEIACEGRNVYACMNLSRMYRIGDGVEKSEEKATLFKEKAKDIRDDMKKKQSLGLQQYA